MTRKTHWSLILTVMLLFTVPGCLVWSTAPLYFDGGPETSLDERLLGTWTVDRARDGQGDGLARLVGTWKIEQANQSQAHYRLTAVDDQQQKATFLASIVELGERRFLDLQSVTDQERADANPWLQFTRIPVHNVLRLKVNGKQEVEVAAPQLKEMKQLLRDRPELIDHTLVKMPTDDDPSTLPVLTGDTPTLRTFVRDHLSDDPYFRDFVALKRAETSEGN